MSKILDDGTLLSSIKKYHEFYGKTNTPLLELSIINEDIESIEWVLSVINLDNVDREHVKNLCENIDKEQIKEIVLSKLN